MSRIGKLPIPVPSGVDVAIDDAVVTVKGPKGTLSHTVAAPITVEQMAEDAVALLDALGIATAHVVGHSLGGTVAVQLALLAPTRVKSLSLLCTFARGKDVAPLSAR